MIIHLPFFNLCLKNFNYFFLTQKIGANLGFFLLLMFLFVDSSGMGEMYYFWIKVPSEKGVERAWDEQVFNERSLHSTFTSSRGNWVKVIKSRGILGQSQL